LLNRSSSTSIVALLFFDLLTILDRPHTKDFLLGDL
jgi:hypothetical protein